MASVWPSIVPAGWRSGQDQRRTREASTVARRSAVGETASRIGVAGAVVVESELSAMALRQRHSQPRNSAGAAPSQRVSSRDSPRRRDFSAAAMWAW